jgi:lysophospholipase L1-like esterase
LGLDPDLIWSKSGASEDYLDSPWASQSLFFLHDPVHLTPKGHALLAAEVFKGLREEGLLGELPASAGD